MTTTRTHVRQRLLGSCADSYAEHLHRLGPLPASKPAELIRTIVDSGLGGRGGAAFPTGRKLVTVAGNARGLRSVVVANGAEGEPASDKDRLLLTHAPHLVLDGLALAVRAVGAADAYLYAPEYLLHGPIRRALAQRSDRVSVRAVAAPDSFIAGQESAAVSVINGGRAVPTITPPAVFERGVGGRPTLVQNVESLAQIALIARRGAHWFREAGTGDEPGTRLATISGAVAQPGVYEVDGGAALVDLIEDAGGLTEPVHALLVGGYHGGWVPWTERSARTSWTRSGLARYDAAPGAGVVIALPARRCGLQAAADITAYLAGQSAAQCGPCRNGLPTLADLLAQLAGGKAPAKTVSEIHRIVGLVAGRGACQHPGGTARLVRSTLRTFAPEVDHHLSGYCSTGIPLSVRRRS